MITAPPPPRIPERSGKKWREAWDAPRIFGALICVLTIGALFLSVRSPLSRALLRNKPIFGLLVGTDWVDNARHSDTMVLVRYDTVRKTLDLLALPRDTRIDYSRLRVRRLNEVYAYAFRASNRNHDAACRELIQAVTELLFPVGPPAAPGSPAPAPAPEISYYAQIDYGGFRKMVDLLGGIPVRVDEPMHYDDSWGKLHIHFDPGEYLLNGQKALEYVRYRGRDGDFGRVLRQQEFLLSILASFKKPANIFRLPEIVWVSVSAINTNMGLYERLLVLWELKGLSRDRVRLVQLPGKFSHGFWLPDPAGVAATSEFLVHGREPDAKALAMPMSSAAVPQDALQSAELTPAPWTVEVWNASGKSGLALDVVRTLRKAGYDVVKWGNYESLQKRTLVRDHRGDSQKAQGIAAALAPSSVEIYTRVDPKPLVDAEVVLGEDFAR